MGRILSFKVVAVSIRTYRGKLRVYFETQIEIDIVIQHKHFL